MPEMVNRRRQIIVNKIFQYKILYSLIGLVLISVALAHGLAMTAAKLLGSGQVSANLAETLKGSLPQGFSWEWLWIPALMTVLIGIVLALFFGLHYSHRIAGPLFNLKRVLARVGGGDLGTQMHIRAKDELHDIEDAFNQMVTGLNRRLDLVQQALAQVPEPHKSKLQKQVSEAFYRSAGETVVSGTKPD